MFLPYKTLLMLLKKNIHWEILLFLVLFSGILCFPLWSFAFGINYSFSISFSESLLTMDSLSLFLMENVFLPSFLSSIFQVVRITDW